MRNPEPQHPGDLTRFLGELSRGEAAAGDALMPHVYAELRAIADGYLARQPGHRTLQPTALVHEAFLRLFGREASWGDSAHFYALAAKTMRNLLVDSARERRSQKRGDGQRPVTLDQAVAAPEEFDLLDVHLALEELGLLDERQARVVELRYFGGFEMQEVASALRVSVSTVEREWRAARAWLGVRLQGGAAE